MSLNVIYGRAGSGKSTYLFNYIKANLNKEKIYVITPEQFSFTAEKKLLNAVSTGAIISAEVLTFNRMAYRVLNEVGGITKTNLLASGKAMLIYQILLEQKDKFNFIGKSNENVELVSTQITEFKKHGVNVSNLESIAENVKDTYLKLKMKDMQTIYSIYEQTLKNNYIDENDILTILAEKLEKSNLFNETTIILDEFAGFTKQEYDIIKILLKKAKNLIITICTDSLNESENKEADIFYANKQTWFKLTDICKELGIEIKSQINVGEPKRFENDELKHLEKNIYAIPYHKYEKKVENVNLFLANNPYSEIENLAKQIIKLVKNQDYRFKDISVITKNIDTYSSLCKAIFKKYDIPVFIDSKKDLNQNILVKFVLSVLDIFVQNWSYEAVFSYIKTGLIDIDIDAVYYLENYCLKWGIKGSKWYKGEWNFYDESEEEIQKINYARKMIIEPLLKFKNDLSGTKDVKEITKKLYEFLIQNNIPEKMEQKIEELNKIGQLDIAKEYESSFKILIQVFDEIVLVLGKSKVTFEKYAELFKIGLRNSDLGKIPTSQDEVIIGDIDRSRTHKVKAVFIIGLNDGVFPTVNRNEGFFDDKDREQLKQEGIELAKGTIEKLYDDNFNIYKAFTTAENKLFLSYPSSDIEGKALRPSILINKIKKIYTNVKEQSDIVNNKEEILLVDTTFDELLVNLRKLKDEEKVSNIWFDVYNYYISQKEWREKLLKAIELLDYNNTPEKINQENIEKLYGNTIKTSISRLEQYSSCPFSYYIKYGLKLSERDIFKIQTIDTGNFMHEVIDDFFGEEEAKDIKQITDKQIEKLVNKIIEQKLELKQNYIFTSVPKYKVLINRLKRVITKSMKYIVDSIRYSDFEVLGHELEFGNGKDYEPIKVQLENGKNIEIIGKIDRIDIMKNENGDYIRIIDYKSSVKNMDLNEVMAGIRLQLLTYMDAMCKQEEAEPAGVFYYNLIEPMVKASKNMTDEEIEEEIRKQFKMRGLILADIDIVRKMDKKLVTGSSNIIPATINKDETLSNKSSNITKMQFEYLQKYTNKIIKQISEEILSGNIDVKPYYNTKDKKTPCEYCTYKSICQFDTGICKKEYKYISNLEKETILEMMKEE